MQQSMWDMVIYILATLPPQILHLLARFGKSTPEGAQLAVDATLASPLTSAGQPKRRAGRYARAPKQGKQRSRFTPNCKAQAGAVWSSWPLNLGGGGVQKPLTSSDPWPTQNREQPHPISDKPPSQPSWHDGRFPSPLLLCMLMPHPYYSCRIPAIHAV